MDPAADRSQTPDGPLEIGLNAPLHVREERLSSCPNACRLLYVSDIHLRGGRSGRLAMQVVYAMLSFRVVARRRLHRLVLVGSMQ